jgi:hypothetical protein
VKRLVASAVVLAVCVAPTAAQDAKQEKVAKLKAEIAATRAHLAKLTAALAELESPKDKAAALRAELTRAYLRREKLNAKELGVQVFQDRARELSREITDLHAKLLAVDPNSGSVQSVHPGSLSFMKVGQTVGLGRAVFWVAKVKGPDALELDRGQGPVLVVRGIHTDGLKAKDRVETAGRFRLEPTDAGDLPVLAPYADGRLIGPTGKVFLPAVSP